ncbi:hypothetical protein C3747_19g119 [Trypanosoma cruzi]|nr:hypothetical protein C3747_19g119 [Trypanosoma cruzi]
MPRAFISGDLHPLFFFFFCVLKKRVRREEREYVWRVRDAPIMVSFLFLACVFIMFQLFFPFYFAAATRLNSFTVVVLEDQAAEALRKAPDGAFLQTPSYLVQLSSHWTVVERNVFGGDSPDEEEKGGQMLHCRLPRPQTQEMVASLEKSYMKFHQGRVRAAIWKWLLDLTHRDGCVFGDGEGTLTGVSEWYLFCPHGLIRKVNRTAVAALYDVSPSELPRVVKKLVQRYRGSGEKMGCGNALDKWTSVIGKYKKHTTQPYWDANRRAWGLTYPNDRVCVTGRVNASAEGETKRREDTRVEAGREMWETVVRLYCRRGRGSSPLQEWTVTEVRQSCLYEIVLLSPVVCEWEQRMEHLGVNPIPCIVV